MCECVGASVCTFPMGLGPVLFACRVPHPLATFPGVFFKRKIFSGKAEKSQQRRLWQLKIIFAARAFLAATHVRAPHTRHKRSAASTLAKQRPGSVRSKPQLCIAGRAGAEWKEEGEGQWVAAQASLRLWQLRQRVVKHTHSLYRSQRRRGRRRQQRRVMCLYISGNDTN